VDVAPETVARQRRDVAAVVNVRVRKQERMDAARLEPKSAVPFVEFLAPSLKQAAIQQEGFASGFHTVFGSGHAPHCAEKLYFHQTSPAFAEL
jgi:hypothetical protein